MSTKTREEPCRIVYEKCECHLEELVKHSRTSVGKCFGLHPLDVIDLGLQLCDALTAVHRGARSLHLDVKPRNVLFKQVTPDSNTTATTKNTTHGWREGKMIALLSDFGLTKLVPASVSTSFESVATRVDTMADDVGKGTAGYAPLEQFEGHKGRRRSDVYGLGATLAFALDGKRPFPGMTDSQIGFKLAQGVPHILLVSILT